MVHGAPAPAAEAAPSGRFGPTLLDTVAPSSHAFFLDVDGTLLDLAPHPDAVTVPEGLVETLAALAAATDGALALVSGRTLARLDALFAPIRLPIAGSHGAELRPHAELPPERAAPLGPALGARLAAVAAAHGGLFTEDKGAAFAVHYRDRPQVREALAADLAAAVADTQDDLALLPGHFVFEVKRRGHDKGTAIRAFMARAPFAGRTPLFIGDDVTDEAGFAAVTAAGGLAIAVGAPRRGAALTLDGPATVRSFLFHLAAEPRQRRR